MIKKILSVLTIITTLTFFMGCPSPIDPEDLVVEKFTITYNANGNSSGSVPVDSTEYETDQVATILSIGTLVKTGYTFAGWNSLADGNGTAYSDGEEITINTENITLYAQWTINSYNVIFNANTGSGNMTVLPANYNETKALTSNAFTKTGYTFTGWNSLADGNGTAYADGSEVTMGTENIDLYAQWTINGYNVTFNANTGSGDMAVLPANYNETKTLTANTFTKTGYTFTGWNTKADGTGTAYADDADFTIATTNVTLYAQWTINDYNITFNANTGSGSMAVLSANYNQTKALTTNAFTKTGYTFTGWNSLADGNGTAYTDGEEITIGTAGVELFAQWTVVTYTLTYNLNEGTNAGTNPAEYTVESTEITLADPERTDYRFDGWFDHSDFSGAAITSIPAGSIENITFWAKWTPNQGIDVSVPVTEEGSITFNCPITIEVGDEYTFSIEEDDYVSYSWRVDGNSGVSGNNNTVSADDGDYDFDAARLYSITVIVKDADGNMFSDNFNLTVTN